MEKLQNKHKRIIAESYLNRSKGMKYWKVSLLVICGFLLGFFVSLNTNEVKRVPDGKDSTISSLLIENEMLEGQFEIWKDKAFNQEVLIEDLRYSCQFKGVSVYWSSRNIDTCWTCK